jgi:hypothetical protein
LAQIFPKWTNYIGPGSAVGSVVLLCAIVGFFWFYGSPKFTDVGYRPDQPVHYSHKLHAGDLGIDCRYCHTSVETGAQANVPPTATCMNCHTLIKPESEKLQLVRDSWKNDMPIQWTRVNDIADYAYFDHSMHITAGVGCIDCHGNIAEMEVVKQAEPLSMGWCLECHRNPEMALRPLDQVANMNWVAPENQEEIGKMLRSERNINPPTTNCSGCHR